MRIQKKRKVACKDEHERTYLEDMECAEYLYILHSESCRATPTILYDPDISLTLLRSPELPINAWFGISRWVVSRFKLTSLLIRGRYYTWSPHM